MHNILSSEYRFITSADCVTSIYMLLYNPRMFSTHVIALGNKRAPINLHPDNVYIVRIPFNSGLYEIVAY